MAPDRKIETSLLFAGAQPGDALGPSPSSVASTSAPLVGGKGVMPRRYMGKKEPGEPHTPTSLSLRAAENKFLGSMHMALHITYY